MIGRRFALYWSPPPASAMAAFGAACLGRCADTGESVRQPAVDGVDPDRLADLTAAPRRYGFHATLKPPFALAASTIATDLHASAADFAKRQRGFDLPPLRVATIGEFIALVTAEPCAAIDRLAAACVIEFDRFRAPPTAEERARRRPESLTPRERDHLDRWGYPYVLADFTFHLTLSGPVPDPAERAALAAGLARVWAPLAAARPRVDALAVFEQPDAAAPFRVAGRYRFGG